MGLFREILDTWKEKETGETTRVGQKRLKQLKTRKDQLVEAFPYRQTIDQATYQQEKDKLDQEIALAEMAAHDAKLDVHAHERGAALARVLAGLETTPPAAPLPSGRDLRRR